MANNSTSRVRPKARLAVLPRVPVLAAHHNRASRPTCLLLPAVGAPTARLLRIWRTLRLPDGTRHKDLASAPVVLSGTTTSTLARLSLLLDRTARPVPTALVALVLLAALRNRNSLVAPRRLARLISQRALRRVLRSWSRSLWASHPRLAAERPRQARAQTSARSLRRQHPLRRLSPPAPRTRPRSPPLFRSLLV